MDAQTAAKGVDAVVLVNISTEKWPPRQRTYFGSLSISSPQPGEAFATSRRFTAASASWIWATLDTASYKLYYVN